MKPFSQRAHGVFADWFGDGPWRSKSVRVALVAVLAGFAFWISDIKPKPAQNKPDQTTTGTPKITPLDDHWNWSKPVPFYVRMGASYVAAYCLGWLFRRVLRLILIVSLLVIAFLAYGRLAGLNVTQAQVQVKQSRGWARHVMVTEKDHLKGLLPSATAGAVGMFLGFRRRNQARVAEPEV